MLLMLLLAVAVSRRAAVGLKAAALPNNDGGLCAGLG
jgi:hypothetical protein